MQDKTAKPKWIARNFRKRVQSQKDEKPLEIRKLGRPQEWNEEAIEAETEALKEWIKDKDNYYFTSFLVARSLSDEHIARFEKRSESFRETLALARRVQELRLVQLALTKEHDGTFTKFVLANRAGWKEKTELSSDSKNPLSFILSSIDSQTKDITIDANAIEMKSNDEDS